MAQLTVAALELMGHTDDADIAPFVGVPADAYVVEVVHRAHPPAQRNLTTAGIGITHTQTVELGGRRPSWASCAAAAN